MDIRGLAFAQEKGAPWTLPPDVRASIEQQWLPLNKEFELAPGGYQARLVVRDTRGRARASRSAPRTERSSLPLGRYELILNVRDDVSGRWRDVHEPFSIEPDPATRASATR